MADPVTFTSAAFNQLRLNQLDAEIFPLPKFRLFPRGDIHGAWQQDKHQGTFLISREDLHGLPEEMTLLRSNLHISIRPPKPPIIVDRYDLFHPAATLSPVVIPALTQQQFCEAQAKVCVADVDRAAFPGSDVTILPLGTGSALPSKYRNGQLNLS